MADKPYVSLEIVVETAALGIWLFRAKAPFDLRKGSVNRRRVPLQSGGLGLHARSQVCRRLTQVDLSCARSESDHK